MKGDRDDGIKNQSIKGGMPSQETAQSMSEKERARKLVFKKHGSQEPFVRAMKASAVPRRGMGEAGKTEAFWSQRPRA